MEIYGEVVPPAIVIFALPEPFVPTLIVFCTYDSLDIFLEIVAVAFGFASVWYSKQNNILVFPTGIISTSIFVYLLFKWQLIGDMMINGYYFIMSIYGWYIWTRKVDETHHTPITSTTKKEKRTSIIIFISTLLFVFIVYNINSIIIVHRIIWET